MATDRSVEPKQLEGDDLEEARRASARIEESLRTLSAIAHRNLGNAGESYPSSATSGFKNEFLIFATGSSKQIHSNPPDGPCYVMVDPPGITRECSIEESTTCHAVDELLETLAR
jgi:hypothetical protein